MVLIFILKFLQNKNKGGDTTAYIELQKATARDNGRKPFNGMAVAMQALQLVLLGLK